MKTMSFLTVLLFLHWLGYAQTIVKGNITDSSGTALYPATVSIFRLPDSVMIRGVASDKNGFSVQVPSAGDYLLRVSFVGYREEIVAVHISKEHVFQAGTIRLAKSEGGLVEVVVRAAIPPAIVKRDTMVYNAGAYKTRPNATVEDLLRRLPGVEVDADGNITMQGQKVEKIYIDGKEFFLNDPRIASQNLSADMVQSIEAFDAASDKAKFTGIRDPKANKALNLKLKKNKKKGLYGKLYTGYGTEGSYSAGATANRFQGDRWLFGNINGNNINNLFTGSDHTAISFSPGRQTGSALSLNYRDNWGTKINGVINYIGNENRSTQIQSSRRQTFFGDSTQVQNNSGSSSALSRNHNLDGRITWNIDSLNSIVYTPSFALQHSMNGQADTLSTLTQKNGTSYLSNAGNAGNTSDGNGYTLNNSVAWQRRFQKKGRYFYGSFTEGHGNQDIGASLHSLLALYDSSGAPFRHTSVDQQSKQHTGTDTYNLGVAYTEPISKNHILDFGYTLNASRNSSDKNSFDFDSLTGAYDLPDTLTTNHFINTNTVHRADIGFNSIGQALNYQLGIAAQYSSLQNLDKSSDSGGFRQHFVNWFPRVSLFYDLSKGKNLTLRYNGNSTNPTTDQLQPLPDLSNPLLVKLGNPLLKQQFDHVVNIGYNSFNSTGFSNLLVQVNADYAENKIVPSNITLASGVQQVQYINVNGAYDAGSDISYGFPLSHSRHGNAKFNTVIQYTRDISFVNGVENTRKAFTGGENVNINYNYKEKLFVEAHAGINYTLSSYSIQQGGNTALLTQYYGVDFSYALPLHFNLSGNYILQVTGSQGSLPGKQTGVLNAVFYKNILNQNAGEIRLSGFDLLNTAGSFSQSTGADFIATQSTNMLGRVFLLSFIYRFHQFSKPA